MNMGGHDDNVTKLQDRFPHAKLLNWTDHLSTIRRAAQYIRTTHFWVISSCCDYLNFDFSWVPPKWENQQIHCWPSGKEQFGDTFLVPTKKWKDESPALVRLEEFQYVNFFHDPVLRLPWQTVSYQNDSLLQCIKETKCNTPYVLFGSAEDKKQIDPWLWRELPIIALNTSKSITLVPRTATGKIHTQIYDYPYLKTKKVEDSSPLDIVFISNNEPDAERWYRHLVSIAPNRNIHWVKDVTGRSKAYKAAANASTTPWFFTVFAKLEVNPNFDWGWQPDFWQQPKHYIFNATNPVNGLEYGHQAMICYNKKLVLSNDGKGIDFTLHQPHESVDISSGIAHFNVSPIVTWRTSFREAIKLKAATDDTSAYRLKVWMTKAEGENAKWSLAGANDAVEYYQSVEGDMQQLLLSYEWKWLNDYYNNKYQS